MKYHPKLSIALPASLASDIPHLREKTFKIGLVGRAAAIFRIDEIVIFHDTPNSNQSHDSHLIASILSYIETPQYLRKRLFGLRPELRYAGILPPLRTPHHPICSRIRDLKIGEYREGVVISQTDAGSYVDIGVKRSVLVSDVKLPTNNRVTVKLAELGRHLKGSLVRRDDVEPYWGYQTRVSAAGLRQLVKTGCFDLVVATSRRGVPFMKVVDEMTEQWNNASRILIAFGSPTAGLHEILRREGAKLSEVTDFVVNLVPGQGTETVRTVEAVLTCLAVLNISVGTL
ncbi:MAG: RNA-binding protein [Candidatus Bathyarchaeota archaeon]|nr:MAG: RNA-binding protein [Candidatus Bathyarchaeota archaeon]